MDSGNDGCGPNSGAQEALALEEYARQACNTKAEWKAAEIRIRAERKAGQLMSEMEKSKGGPANERRVEGTSLMDVRY